MIRSMASAEKDKELADEAKFFVATYEGGRAASERIIKDVSPYIHFGVRTAPSDRNGNFHQIFLCDLAFPYFKFPQRTRVWSPSTGFMVSA
ncbi:unnamed protein product [Tilletia laevis]|uniref:Uncharacterized protein n=2 Tax=Tilletia TaxID=13289 RepID=A0A9N8M404_9BASI|nr:hypothetical protein CF335_g9219 [Tilletia laevis]KAE8183581.1 hypothetical protein CF328_g8137 [Tilletia controversa]KAE8237001.1 hypothetical protein A4X03_0g9252 [Tilletia caries]KAE8182419.1 hypothetical protein CF336_g8556 [Tilletia laevis]CAD6956758.1 unnamed protein product [Tilletia laevis]